MKLALRLITVVCYFLPCTFFLVTCNKGIELRLAYNQIDADKNIQLENERTEISAVSVDTTQNDHQLLVDTVNQNFLIDTPRISSDTLSKFEGYVDRILQNVIVPTNKSLSGIGSIFYFKNLIGKIVIAISFLISLTLLLGLKFLKSPQINLYLALSSVLCLTIFIIDSFFSNVTLLWGAWTLLILLIVQLILLFRNNTMKAYR